MSSSNAAGSKGILGATGTNKNNNNNTSERRRSSASSGKFAGLTSQKRNSTDAAAEARRLSFHEQSQKPGFIGQMWHNFTKGGAGGK